jgi:hypothetical protein
MAIIPLLSINVGFKLLILSLENGRADFRSQEQRWKMEG